MPYSLTMGGPFTPGDVPTVDPGGTSWSWAAPAAAPAQTPQFPLMFVRNNVQANLTASAVLAPNNATGYPMAKGGTLRGLSALFTGTFNTGTITVRIRKNGTPDGTLTLGPIAVGTGAGALTTGTGVTWAAGDYLSIEIDTSATFNGNTGTWTFIAWAEIAALP